MQVLDVKMQNEYNLRLKDAALNDKVRELTERHAAETEQAAASYAVLQQDREQQRVQYEERLQDAAEHQQVLHSLPQGLVLAAHAFHALRHLAWNHMEALQLEVFYFATRHASSLCQKIQHTVQQHYSGICCGDL